MAPASNPQRVLPSDPDWATHVARVVAEATAVDGVSPLNEKAQLGLAHHGLTGAELHVVDGGFALVRDGNLDLVVAPSARRQGLGGALLDAATAARQAWSHRDHPAARALAASHGFVAARELRQMLRSAAPIETTATQATIRPFRPGDEAAFLAVNAQAFSDHPEQASLTLDGLRERMAEPWFDPEGLFLAEHDGEVVGFHWTKIHPDGLGEVYVIGIAPSAQGLGLGRALVTRGLAHLQPRDVVLFVEGSNPGAIALYESLAFEHVGTDVQYLRS